MYSFHKVYTGYITQRLTEEFEDTKGVIRIRISKKNRQHNGHKKKYKRTNKGNNKITELRTILQRESQNS